MSLTAGAPNFDLGEVSSTLVSFFQPSSGMLLMLWSFCHGVNSECWMGWWMCCQFWQRFVQVFHHEGRLSRPFLSNQEYFDGSGLYSAPFYYPSFGYQTLFGTFCKSVMQSFVHLRPWESRNFGGALADCGRCDRYGSYCIDARQLVGLAGKGNFVASSFDLKTERLISGCSKFLPCVFGGCYEVSYDHDAWCEQGFLGNKVASTTCRLNQFEHQISFHCTEITGDQHLDSRNLTEGRTHVLDRWCTDLHDKGVNQCMTGMNRSMGYGGGITSTLNKVSLNQLEGRTHVYDRWCADLHSWGWKRGVIWDVVPIICCSMRCRQSTCETRGRFVRTSHHSIYCRDRCISVQRHGEARHPGPCSLTCGNINPTQLLGKEDVIPTLANTQHAIWTCSETSHTTTARRISTHRCRKLGFQTAWSRDNPQLNASSEIRGKASGTCIISTLPIRHNEYGIPEDVLQTKRYCEAVVQLSPGVCMLVIALYGPTYGATYVKPEAILHAITACAFERGQRFNGPVMIGGDLNIDLEAIPHWQSLVNRGWNDLHVLSSQRNGHHLEPTCREARHSVQTCRIKETFDFYLHPTLYAEMESDILTRSIMQWSLPKSMDSFIFDKELREEITEAELAKHRSGIHEALKNGSSDQALKKFIRVFEQGCIGSCVTVDGQIVTLPRSCLGRDKHLPFARKPPANPCCRMGRHGDLQPCELQVGVELRRWLKQSRRLDTLEHLLRCQGKHSSIDRAVECQMLRQTILKAHGFHQGFATWIGHHLDIFVPCSCPHVEYVAELKKELLAEYRKKNNAFLYSKMKIRRKNVALDVQTGGTRAFQDIKEAALPPPDHVAFEVSSKLKRVRWPKQGLRCVECICDNHGFKPDYPLHFQQQIVNIEHIRGAKLFLQEPIKLRNHQDFKCWQIHRSSDPEQMHQHTMEAWGQFWQRDDTQNTEQWEECLPFMTALSDCPSLEFKEFELGEWRSIVNKSPSKSARGSCAFTKKDLQLMPQSLTLVLFTMFAAFEEGCQWPFRWTIARTACLRKQSGTPSSPLDLRPITIMAKVYRLWSSYRSKQVLRYISGLLPPQVSGNTGVMSADILACMTMLEIEEASASDTCRVGAVLDLKKCYDLIPRIPMLMVLRLIGVPTQYIKSLASMFTQVRRTFDILGTLGPLFQTSTGIPQGCSFSVACMCALTLFASKVVVISDTILPIFFADNWSLIARSVNELEAALEILERLAKCLKMVFAPDKSWLWSSQSRDRKRLQRIRLQGREIPIRNQATDLGCDVTYRGNMRKAQTKVRMVKAVGRLKSIGSKRLPFKFRRTAAKLAGHGAMLYSSEFVYITEAQWHKIRTATAESITMSKSGANAWLALGCADHNLDPQFRGALRRFRFWRKLFRILPHYKQVFFERIAQPWSKKSTPSGSFRKSLKDIGWTCSENGGMQHSSGLVVNWFKDSWTLLSRVMRQSWTFQMMKAINNRRGADMHSFDPIQQVALIAKRPPQEQGILLTYCSGKHFTADMLAKFAGGDDKCPFCHKVADSRWHRVHECESLRCLEARDKKAIEWVRNQKEAVTHFCLCPADNHHVIQRMGHAAEFPYDPPEHNEVDAIVFTDGSAVCTDRWEAAWSSGAFIQVNKFRGWKKVRHKSQLVPGSDHSSFRGETLGILLALNHFEKLQIFCDCQSVVDRLDDMILCFKNGKRTYACEHWDMWQLIWGHVCNRHPNSISITKIAAHQDWKQLPTNSEQRWLACWNDRVDQIAKEVLFVQHRNLIDISQKWLSKRMIQMQKMEKFADFIIAIATKTFEVRKPHVVEVAQSSVDFQTMIPPGPYHTIDCVLSEDMCKLCPYTCLMAESVGQWASSLQWPLVPCLEPISLLELYVDWCLYSGLSAPLQILEREKRKKGHRPVYQMRGESIVADSAPWTLSLQSSTWSRFFRWFLTNSPNLQHLKVQWNRCLQPLGFRLWHTCIEQRPVLTHQTEPFSILYRYFHTTSGKRRSMAGAFHLTSLRETDIPCS